MISRTGSIVLTVVLAVPMVVLGQLALTMFSAGGFATAAGIGLVILMGLGVWMAVASLRFGFQVERLSRRLAEDDGLPDPSGISYEQALAELDEAPSDWRYWYRLGHAYHRAGDSSRAREAMQHALRLSARSGDGSRATSV